MKKTIFTILTLLTLFSSAAQKKNETTFGIKGGFNISELISKEGKTFKETSSLFGINVGGFVNVPFSKQWSIQPEVLYSNQGSNLNYITPEDIRIKYIHFNYINIPLMVKYYFYGSDFNIDFGPQFCFLTNAKAKISFGNLTEINDISSRINLFDLAFSFGFGYDFNKKLNLSFRTSIGTLGTFSNLETNDTQTRNKTISIFLAYKI